MTSLLLQISVAAAVGLLATPAFAQAPQWPTKPIRLVVPATAGDGSDVLARTLAPVLAELLGQPLVIENRPGAGGSIAGAAVVNAPADGYNVMLVNGSSHGVTPGLYAKLPYDTLRDFAPVGLIATSPNLILIHPAVPARSIAEFLAHVRANPGKVNIASAGNGSLSHLSVELFKNLGKLDIVNIGYKGAAPALTDVVAGQVQATIINIPSALGLVKADKLRALAVTSTKRSNLMPDVPTLAESGLAGYETLAWFGLAMRAGSPSDAIERLNAATNKALDRPEIRAQLTKMGAEPAPVTPDSFGAFMRAEIAKYSKVIRDAGIKVE
jgi:tripartite-type tricarboxylate transporter receptor subunit TctC